MSTTVVYGANDGWLRSKGSSYAAARAGSGTLYLNFGGDTTQAQVGQGYDSDWTEWFCYEAFERFDTSAIGTDVVSAAVLSLKGQYKYGTVTFDIEARVHDWGESLATGDWVAGADLSGKTSVASIANSAWSASAYNDFTDVALPANVNKTGITSLIVVSSKMTAGTAATVMTERVDYYAVATTGTTSDPKLTITHAPPAGQAEALAGVIAAVATVAGTLSAVVPLAGAISAVGASTGTLSATVPLSGTVAASGAATGALVAGVALSGAVGTSSAVSGALSASVGLSGVIAVVSTATGALGAVVELAGGVTATTSSSAALSATVPLSAGILFQPDLFQPGLFQGGGIRVTSSVSADLGLNVLMAGTVAASTTVTGALLIAAGLAGTIAASSTVSGALDAQVGLSGAITGTSDVTGAIGVMAALAGSIDVASTVTGTLILAGSGSLTLGISYGAMSVGASTNLTAVGSG